MACFFPLFFSAYWAHGLPPGTRTFWLGVASSASSVVVMIIAPLLGGLADRKGYKKRFLFAATLLGAIRSEEHTSELQSLMRISYAVFCLKKKITQREALNCKHNQRLTNAK